MKQKLDIQKITKIAYIKDYMLQEIINSNSIESIYRVYENEKLGISYLKNNDDDDFGYRLASENMKYDYKHANVINMQKNEIYKYDVSSNKDTMDMIKNIWDNISYISKEISIKYTNTGARYTLTDTQKLHINFESGINIFEVSYMDTIFLFEYKKIKLNTIIQDMKRLLCLQDKSKIKFYSKKIIIPTNLNAIYDFFENILSAENILKKDILGKKIFSEKLTLYTSLDDNDSKSTKYGLIPFFDFEGSYNPYYKTELIENGCIQKPYTNKDISTKYDFVNTACAYSQKDEYFSCKLLGAYIQESDYALNDMVDTAIFIENANIMIQEDDIIIKTRDAYRFERGNITDKIENFEIKINGYDLFSKHFLGVSKDYIFGSDTKKAIVFEL